jgi:hypothetical protein
MGPYFGATRPYYKSCRNCALRYDQNCKIRYNKMLTRDMVFIFENVSGGD